MANVRIIVNTRPRGYVYVLKVTGAFIVPQKSSGHVWTGTFAEYRRVRWNSSVSGPFLLYANTTRVIGIAGKSLTR